MQAKNPPAVAAQTSAFLHPEDVGVHVVPDIERQVANEHILHVWDIGRFIFSRPDMNVRESIFLHDRVEQLLINFLDRGIVSLLVGPIKRDLRLSDFQMSLVMGFAFVCFYALLGLTVAWSPTLIRIRNLLSTFVLMIWRFCQAGSCGTRSGGGRPASRALCALTSAESATIPLAPTQTATEQARAYRLAACGALHAPRFA